MTLTHKTITFVSSVLAVLLFTSAARACPFCSAVQVTFTEEIKSNDVAVIAALVERPKPTDKAEDAASELELLKAKFKVVDVLKGDQHTKPGQTFSALYIGEAPIGKEFLVMGIEPQKVEWGAPIELSDRAKEYLHKIMKLPAKGPERLAFFQDHLEDKDSLISRDAYDEFATTPYADLKELKSKMKHNMFVERLEDPKTDASHRRLYLTMLGICGSKSDLSFLEKMLRSDDRTMKSGLDALIGCYLTLKGASGLPLVEELFIKRENVEFTDQYQAIMALRFHAEEGSVIEKDKIAAVLRHMLDRPKYADLVVADLARWQDWSVIDRLYALFRDADQDSLWVREPIVNYMRACPLPKAKEYLKEFDKIDPKAVKRASGFFPLGAPKTSPVGEKADPAAKRTDAAPGNEAAQGKTSDAARPRTFKTVAYGPEPAAVADARSASPDVDKAGTRDGGISERNEFRSTLDADQADTSGGTTDLSTQPPSPPGDTPHLVLIAVPLAVGLGVGLAVFYISGGTNARAPA